MIIGLDLGTSSISAVLFDPERIEGLVVVDAGLNPLTTFFPKMVAQFAPASLDHFAVREKSLREGGAPQQASAR